MFVSTPNGDTPNGDTPNPTPNPHTQRGKEENKTAIIYNDDVTVWNIPLEAYEYVVNASPPSSGAWSGMPSPPARSGYRDLPASGRPHSTFRCRFPLKFTLRTAGGEG